MSKPEITRNEFLRGGCCLAAGALVGNILPAETAAAGQAKPQSSPGCQKPGTCAAISLRPYQLLCLVCSFGEDAAGPKQGRLKEVLDAIRRDPDVPITLRANAGDVFVFQDPGMAEDTSEGREFNRKRDLDILQAMSWAPGTTLPARVLLSSLLKHITTVAGICGYDTVTSDDWRGCPKAKSGLYEKGCQRGVKAIIPPRTEQEMAQEKVRSMQAVTSADVVTVRPHILLCAVCQYGGGTRPPFKPDNLPELMELIFTKNRDFSIRLAEAADWMMCAPCPSRVAGLNACVNVLGAGGLSNQKRDLDMLQKLGLRYGSTMKAKALFRLILDKIPSTQGICKREGNASPCVWWDGCGESNVTKGNANYEKGRKELLEKLRS